ncbi:FecR family protein [Mucilaginibacter sp. OK098]|uniref:FecR family protein n=1 Tax=Mucilaginibacter sp. OK098 TaxID=1855297 RepID=UPI0009201349|nr:FecR family protein [Mucilaginibacter sp. OK098]SHN21276.1 FecR family protein [Mucilaginibacter sp. OK098]
MDSENKPYNINQLADKWLKGTITPEERVYFETWYAGFNDEELIMSDSKYTSTGQMRDDMYKRIAAEIDDQQRAKPKVIHLLRRMVAAAAIVFIIGGAALYRVTLLNLINPVHQLQMVTAKGQHKQLLLSDGTKIWVSPATTITYPDKFRGDKRFVNIDGEAFFEVKHDEDHPFIIQSDNIKTTVLGTSFNVDAYKNKATINVTLVSGKVAVALLAGKPQQQIMLPNQRAVFNKATSMLIKQDYPDARKFLTRREGVFQYRGTPLQVVVQDMEDEYGISITINAQLSDKAFYGSLKTTDNINQTLNKLCTIMEVKLIKTGDAYTIK